MALPTPEEFEAFKLFVFRLVDTSLWVILLLAVLKFGTKHVPAVRRRPRKASGADLAQQK